MSGRETSSCLQLELRRRRRGANKGPRARSVLAASTLAPRRRRRREVIDGIGGGNRSRAGAPSVRWLGSRLSWPRRRTCTIQNGVSPPEPVGGLRRRPSGTKRTYDGGPTAATTPYERHPWTFYKFSSAISLDLKKFDLRCIKLK